MDKIEELLNRGVEKIYPSKEELEKVLRSGKKLKVYQGFDPTGTQLHIGHLIGLKKLKQWQNLGHEVIFLIGDFTGMIGDPTGKDKTRVPLTREQVLENAKTYKEQASKVLNFAGVNPVKIKYNNDWLSKISSREIISITHLLSVNQIIKRDFFKNRLENDMDVSMNEFMYPVLQAYDSVAMDVDVEIGGTDQMFNMMVGRDLMHKMRKKNKFVITTPLLTDSQGVKIGKTEGNVIGLTDKPEDLFGKIMALPDDVITKGLEYLTDVPMEEIKDIKGKIENGENPVIYKKKLAFEIVKELNVTDDAKKAQEDFENTVQGKEPPKEIPVFEFGPEAFELGRWLEDILTKTNLAGSRSEVKRLIKQHGIKVNGKTITDPEQLMPVSSFNIQVGKRKVVKIKIN